MKEVDRKVGNLLDDVFNGRIGLPNLLASEDDGDDNGMSRYMENDDEEGWE